MLVCLQQQHKDIAKDDIEVTFSCCGFCYLGSIFQRPCRQEFPITSALLNAHIVMRQGIREQLWPFWSAHQTALALLWPAKAIRAWLSEPSKALLHAISANVADNRKIPISSLCPPWADIKSSYRSQVKLQGIYPFLFFWAYRSEISSTPPVSGQRRRTFRRLLWPMPIAGFQRFMENTFLKSLEVV